MESYLTRTYFHRQATVTEWLKTLDMEEYEKVFHSAGYETGEDVENLKDIDDSELMKMGITKIGVLNLFFRDYY